MSPVWSHGCIILLAACISSGPGKSCYAAQHSAIIFSHVRQHDSSRKVSFVCHAALNDMRSPHAINRILAATRCRSKACSATKVRLPKIRRRRPSAEELFQECDWRCCSEPTRWTTGCIFFVSSGPVAGFWYAYGSPRKRSVHTDPSSC
jgi:hypothetical protein